MTEGGAFFVRFWGVRGSIACPDTCFVRYGGNTACVEVRCGKRIFIFDGGTGLRSLGNELLNNGGPVDADLFYSHCHFDHVCGVPFFGPADVPTTRLRHWAGNLLPRYTLKQAFNRIFSAPSFPEGTFESLRCNVEFIDFHAGETISPSADIFIRTAPLNHPGGATGYRLEYDGKAIAYVTDTEHRPDSMDANVLLLARNADLLIYDCTYTQEEYATRVGWGHSTWQEGVRLADEAKAKSLAIFHHDPTHDDAFLDRIATEATALRPNSFVAAEGMTVKLA